MRNRRVLLVRYPEGLPREEDFALDEAEVPPLREGEFLIRNLYLSLDAGFRQWMREGAGDNYLSAMPLGQPVMGITLGRVEESRNPRFRAGDHVLGRNRWEQFSVSDAGDFTAPFVPDPDLPLHYYAGILGPTGLTAYFGLMDIGNPQPGETVVVSAAGGAVGTVAGQIAKALGCRTVGIVGSDDKARWLEDEVGYDIGLNYRAPASILRALKDACPEGIDVYFDNVGGEILEAAMGNLKVGARIVLCGMIASYHDETPPPGPRNMWEAITKRATLKGFMVTDQLPRYGEALTRLREWIAAGQIRSFDQIHDGIENTPAAFCGMFRGTNFGKALVRL